LREQDAFQILAYKEIRIASNRGSSYNSADIDEEGGDSGASAAAARGRAATQAVRKGLIQNTIPIFIKLKRLLETKNSPFIGSLMECLRILLKDYKNEIDAYWLLISSFRNSSSMTCKSMILRRPNQLLQRLLPKCKNQVAIGHLMFLR
jgi:hypothetical protein